MTISTVRKFGVGVASAAMVLGLCAPAMAAGEDVLPGVGAKNAGRLAGYDRIQTSLKIAQKAFSGRNPKVVYIASGDDSHLVDSTTAGKLTDGPLVFVSGSSYVSTAVGKDLRGFGASKLVAVGGTNSVSDATLAAVAKAANIRKTARLGGNDRYATADAVAEYIYDQSVDGNSAYADVTNNTNLRRVYFANGADSHVVDSMVAGTLDNGPTLLVKPDGSFADSTVKLIKKTLPLEFVALGGTAAVTDDTVNSAWIIRALNNDWNKSYDLPSLKKAIKGYEHLIDGMPSGNSRNPKAPDFKGLVKSLQDAQNVQTAWNLAYQTESLNLSKTVALLIKNGATMTDLENSSTGLKGVDGTAYDSGHSANADLIKDVVGELVNLYGGLVESGTSTNFKKISEKAYTAFINSATFDKTTKALQGFDQAEFEAAIGLAERVDGAKEALSSWWANGKVAADAITNPGKSELNYTAIASQYADPAAPNSSIGLVSGGSGDAKKSEAALAAVAKTTDWVTEQVADYLKKTKADLAKAQQDLRNGLDMVNSKTVLRLGGKDRYETAAWIANEFGKTYGSTFVGGAGFDGAYVANGMALPDAIVGGQLKNGPILLVHPKGDLPDPIKATAKALPQWNTKGQMLNVYGLGGKAVLPEEQLNKVVATINEGASKSDDAFAVIFGAETIANNEGGAAATSLTVKQGKELTIKVPVTAVNAPNGATQKLQWQWYNGSAWTDLTASGTQIQSSNVTSTDVATDTLKLASGSSTTATTAKVRLVVSYVKDGVSVVPDKVSKEFTVSFLAS